jgi:hypothetical protein
MSLVRPLLIPFKALKFLSHTVKSGILSATIQILLPCLLVPSPLLKEKERPWHAHRHKKTQKHKNTKNTKTQILTLQNPTLRTLGYPTCLTPASALCFAHPWCANVFNQETKRKKKNQICSFEMNQMTGGDHMAANKAAVAVADEKTAYRSRRADSTGQPEPGPHARDSLPAIHRQAGFAARSVSALSDDDSQTHYNSDDSRLLYAESKKRAAGSSGEGGHTQFEVESWPAEHRDSETEDEGDSIKLKCTSGLRASEHATSSCASMLAAGVSGKGEGKDGNDSRTSNQSSATSSPILLPKKVTIAQVPSLVQPAANTIATEIAVQEEPAVPEQKDEQKSPSHWNAARKKNSSAEVKSGEEMEGEGKESAVESAVVLAMRMDDETCKTQDSKQDEAQDAQGGPVFAVFSPSSMQVESQQAQDMESQQAQDIYKSLPVSGVDEGQKEEWKKETMPEPQPTPGRKSSPSLWRTEGSEYLGLDVLRAVTDNDGRVGEGWGSITGWLSADESDFTNDQGEAAELWHVVFDDTALGEEDLEEHEVKEAVLAGQAVLARSKKPKIAIRGGHGGGQVGGKGRGGSNGGRGKGKDKASQHKTLLNSQALVLQGSRYCPLKSDIGL